MKLKKLLIPFSFILSTLYLFSCGPNEPGDPPELVPIPGYQHDIPWPSLADSPWPKFRHDAQGTNRSQYSGPTQGVIEWVNKDFMMMTGAATIGYNNEIFLASLGFETGIYKLNGNTGEIIWRYDSLGRVIDLHPCPIVLSDSNIIASSGSEGRLLKLNIEGNLLWEFKADAQIYNKGIGVDKLGNIYFIDHLHKLYCISPNGELVWSQQNDLFGPYGNISIVFSPDGQTIYFEGFGVGLVAFDIINKSIKWTFGNINGVSFPMVDSQGHIYFLSQNNEINNEHSLYCLNEDGTVNWYFEHGDKDVTEGGSGAPPCIDRDGNIYFATSYKLFSLYYSGDLRFSKKNVDGGYDDIIIDKNNNLYIWISGDDPRGLVLDNKGKTILEIHNGIDKMPKIFNAISSEGQWIVCSYEWINSIYSIK